MVVMDSATARLFTDTIHQFQRDIHREWHKDTYDCWRVNRPAGWADSPAMKEVDVIVQSGFGKLYANGTGGPQGGDMIVALDSPYRFRTAKDDSIRVGYLMVINGYRLFRVDNAKPEDDDNELMNVYLTELFKMPMPEVP